MRRLEKRLHLIEASFHFELSGYAPGSEKWQKYWDAEVEKHFAGEPAQRLSVQIVRSWMQRQSDDLDGIAAANA